MKKISKTLTGDITDEQLGEVLKSFRKQKNMNLRELAIKADLGHPHLSLLERGKRGFSVKTLSGLCKSLGLTLEIRFTAKSK